LFLEKNAKKWLSADYLAVFNDYVLPELKSFLNLVTFSK